MILVTLITWERVAGMALGALIGGIGYEVYYHFKVRRPWKKWDAELEQMIRERDKAGGGRQ